MASKIRKPKVVRIAISRHENGNHRLRDDKYGREHVSKSVVHKWVAKVVIGDPVEIIDVWDTRAEAVRCLTRQFPHADLVLV